MAYEEARVTGYPIHRAIGNRVPQQRSGKERRTNAARLTISDLLGMGKIANVEDSQSRKLERASEHRRVVGTIGNAPFLVVGGDSAADFRRIVEHHGTIGWVIHFEPDFGD